MSREEYLEFITHQPYTVEFQMILDEKQRERAKGSKYMQSKPGDIYQEAYHWLMDNPKKELLFVGMGCQSDGFRKFSEIKGIRDRVYIVDIICHGSPIITHIFVVSSRQRSYDRRRCDE